MVITRIQREVETSRSLGERAHLPLPGRAASAMVRTRTVADSKRDSEQEIIAGTWDLPGHSRCKSWNSAEFQKQDIQTRISLSLLPGVALKNNDLEQKLRLPVHSNQGSSTCKILLKIKNFPVLRKQVSKAPFQQKPGFFSVSKAQAVIHLQIFLGHKESLW